MSLAGHVMHPLAGRIPLIISLSMANTTVALHLTHALRPTDQTLIIMQIIRQHTPPGYALAVISVILTRHPIQPGSLPVVPLYRAMYVTKPHPHQPISHHPSSV